MANSTQICNSAVDWARAIAQDDSHGYDQGSREGPDYDCSSLVSWAYYQAGLNTRPGGYSPATSGMYSVFTGAGFSDVTGSVNLQNGAGMKIGDVVLQPGSHTAIVSNVNSSGATNVINASINENGDVVGGATGDQTGTEIWERPYYYHPWTYCLRYGNGGSTGVSLVNWIPV